MPDYDKESKIKASVLSNKNSVPVGKYSTKGPKKHYFGDKVNKFGFTQFQKNEGNAFGVVGASKGKVGVSAYGITPITKEKRKHWKGVAGAELKVKATPNLSVKVGGDVSQDGVTPKVGFEYKKKFGGRKKKTVKKFD